MENLLIPMRSLPSAPVHHESAAVRKLQRAVRSRFARDHGRRMRQLWPRLDELRAKYIDEEVAAQLKHGRGASELFR